MLEHLSVAAHIFLAGICAYSAIQHGTSEKRWPQRRIHLLFAAAGILASLLALTTGLTFVAATLSDYLLLARVSVAMAILTYSLIPWFISEYSGVRPKLVMVGLSSLYALLFIANLAEPNTLFHKEIHGLGHLELPWSERITLPLATPSAWGYVALLASLLTITFVFYALIVKFRRSHSRTTLIMMAGMVLLLATSLQGLTVRMGMVPFIPLGSFGFLVIVLIMGFTLNSDLQNERRQAKVALQRQSCMQDLLLRTSARFVNLPLEQVASAIHESMGELGEFVGADRCAIHAYDFQQGIARMTHEWCAPGVISPLATSPVTPLSRVSKEALEKQQRGESLWVAEVSALPPSEFRILLQERGVKSQLSVPLMQAGVCVGFVSFSWQRHAHALFSGEQDILTFFVHLLTEINQRAQIDASRRESERRLSTLIGNLSGMVYRCRNDQDGTMEFVSEGARELTGYGPPDLLGDRVISYAALIVAEDRAKVGQDRQASLARQAPFQLTYRIRTATGQERWVWEKGRGIFDANQQLLAREGFITDITERKRTQELLLESEKMRTLAGLAAGMAHEINNPLTGVIGNAQVMAERLTLDCPATMEAAQAHGLDPSHLKQFLDQREILEILDSIRIAGDRAAEVVRNMLLFSRRDEPHQSSMNLNDLIEQTLSLAGTDRELQAGLARGQVIKLYDSQALEVPCHRQQMQQVILNLLRNAVQAMEGNPLERPPILTIRTGRRGPGIVLEIEDNGPGIPPEIRARIFEPFYTTKPVGKGTGLGLFLCYHIVTYNHNGQLTVDSVPGSSTRFTIVLPPVAEKGHCNADSGRGR